MEKTSSCGCLNNSSVETNTKPDDKKIDDTRKRSTSSDCDDTPICDFCGIFNFSNSKCSENYNYTTFDCMDQANKTAMEVLIKEGPDAAIKHMATGKDGKLRDYAEMRQVYG